MGSHCVKVFPPAESYGFGLCPRVVWGSFQEGLQRVPGVPLSGRPGIPVLGSIYQGNPFWGCAICDPQPFGVVLCVCSLFLLDGQGLCLLEVSIYFWLCGHVLASVVMLVVVFCLRTTVMIFKHMLMYMGACVCVYIYTGIPQATGSDGHIGLEVIRHVLGG